MQTNQNSTTHAAGWRIRMASRRRASTLAHGASLLALALAIGGLAGVKPAAAQSYWTGAVSTDWFDPGNWIAGVPGPGISTTLDGPSVVNGALAEADALYLGSYRDGALTIFNGGVLLTALADLAGTSGAHGAITVAGPGSVLINSGNLFLGSYGDATLTIEDGGAVGNNNGWIAIEAGSSGTVTVTGAGSSWINTTDLIVGQGGAGVLTISEGGAVSSASATLGQYASGVVTVTGEDSTWDIAGRLNIGDWGTGALVVENGAAVSSGQIFAGYYPGAEGGISVTGAGSSLTSDGDLYIGFYGVGAVTVANGAQLSTTNSVYVAYGLGSGELTLTGAGSTVHSGGPFSLGGGDGNSSVATVSDGGRLYAPWSAIAIGANTHAAVTVTGAGSALMLDDELMLGLGGHGELTIADGALVQTDYVRMGVGAGSSGVLTLESGGVLATDWIDRTGGDASIVFDGGTLRVTGSAADLLAGFADGDVMLAEGGGTIDTQDNQVITYVGFQGDSDLTKTGSGGLYLDGMNTYAGDTRILMGRIESWTTNGLSANSTHDISTGAILGMAGQNRDQIIGGLAGAGRVILGSAQLTTGANDASTTFSGVISGTGSVVKSGVGTLTLTGANTWSGGARLDAGALTLGSNAALGASSLTLAGGVLGYVDGVTNANSVVIDSATARFEVLAGTAVQSGGISELNGPRAFEKSGDGELVLTGANSWTSVTTVSQGALVIEGVNNQGTGPGHYYVGRSNGDDGVLVIRDGGSVASRQNIIGYQGGSTGAATVTGTDSLWAGGELYVGSWGDGTLTVQAGGELTATGGYIAFDGGSTGAVTVTGAASLWSNSGGLYVGVSGDGSLTIAEGGAVHAGAGTGLVYVAYQSGSGALNIGAAAGDAAVAAGTLEASEVQFGPGTGSLTFNHTGTAYNFDAGIAGVGAIQVLAGLSTLTGDSSAFTGATSVTGGALRVAGTLGGDLTVSGGSLGGGGSVLGAVSVGAGTLTGAAGAVLTMGALTLGSTSTLDATFGAPGANALFDVAGDLTLDGTLRVTGTGRFGAGVYGLISYGGALTDNGLAFGDLPVGYAPDDLALQTSVTGQVNLVSTGIADLLFWDGGDPLNADNAAIDGGDGIWTLTGAIWTDVDGAGNGAMTPLPGLAVFMGGGGTVTLDDSAGGLSVTGVQFAADGYVLTGDALTLVEEGLDLGVNLRVGDGTAAGAGWTATIESDLISTADLSKTDYGTLVLAGDNAFRHIEVSGGLLAITGGGTLSNAYAGIGFDAGSPGAVTVAGAGSRWTSSDDLYVGMLSGGALTIADGGEVFSGNGYLGHGSMGEATVSGAGSAWTTESLYVGSVGSGVLTVENGGALSSAYASLGSSIGSAGAVTVTGSGSVWTNTGALEAGGMGSAVLTIADGGEVSGTVAYLGIRDGGVGDVTVTGAGSAWISSVALYVGLYGSGALTIADGGVVSSSINYLGMDVDAAGGVLVTGVGSVWTNDLLLYVGSQGRGVMTVADGGAVAGRMSYLGAEAGSTGDVTVTGVGSAWTNSSDMYVGYNGGGTLTIADGGAVSASRVVLGVTAGATGVLNIGAADGDAATAAGVLDTPTLDFGLGLGRLVFNHTQAPGGPAHAFGASISSDPAGDARISHLAGFTHLTGSSAGFQGELAISGGVLSVEGTLGAGSVIASVADGATLTGSGMLGGDVAIASGGILAGTSGSTFTIGGDLELEAGALVHAALGAAGGADLFAVGGDLTLAGTLNVTDAGGFGPGLYTIFSYGGALTDNGFTLGAVPAGPYLPGEVQLQTSLTGQVNLASSIGVDLVFWDGDAPASLANGAVDGGDGAWSASSLTFTDANGLANGPARPDPAFVVFTAAPGAVSVDDSVGAVAIAGAQFAVDGYLITGDGVELTAAETHVRVGDGTAAGADYTATIASALTGAGQLVKTDLGTLILTGVNSYGGGVEVRGGTLVGDADSLVGDIVNDATLIFHQTTVATYAGAISGDGEAFKAGAGMLTLTSANGMDWTVQTGGLAVGAAAFAGDVAIETGASFSFDPAVHAVWSGVLSGTGDFDKLGDTTLTLTGDSSGFDGTTSVFAGLLRINGALGGDLVIGADGALGGSGAIGQLTIADGAIVSPGNSIGTLHVNGDLVLAAGSTYEVEVDPAGTASDLIVVTGTATIEGGTVRHIGLGGDYAPSSTYTILNAAGGVSGVFDAIETDFAFLDASLDYAATAVRMTLERNQVAFPDVGETGNQRATGAGVESTGTHAALYGAVIGLSADNARLAFDQLSGELHGSVRSALVEDSGQVRGMVGRRLRQTDASQRGGRTWVQGHGAASHMRTDGNAASLRSRVGGLWLGAEGVAAVGLTLGAAIGADRATHESALSGEAERDGYRLAAYGAGRWGALGLSGGVAAAWDDIEAERTVLFPGFAEQLEADYSAQTTQAFAEATWTIPAGPGVIEPFASVARVHTEIGGFTETGGAGALAVQDQTQGVTLATLGLGARRDFDDGRARTGSLEGRLGWRHASGDLAPVTDQTFAGGTAFAVKGLPVDEDALVAEIGGRFDLGGTLALKVDWTGQAGGHTAQRLAATLNWRF